MRNDLFRDLQNALAQRDERDSVLEAIVTKYRKVHDAWTAAVEDQFCSDEVWYPLAMECIAIQGELLAAALELFPEPTTDKE